MTKPPKTLDELHSAVEAEYWRIVRTAATKVQVEYGNDLDAYTVGSGFPHERPNDDTPEEGRRFLAERQAHLPKKPVPLPEPDASLNERIDFYRRTG